MILTQENIKKIVQDYFKDKPVNSVYLFGSYARGDTDENNDVDLVLEIDDSKKRLSFYGIIELQLGIEKYLSKKVDLVEDHLFFPKVKSSVEQDKNILYQR